MTFIGPKQAVAQKVGSFAGPILAVAQNVLPVVQNVLPVVENDLLVAGPILAVAQKVETVIAISTKVVQLATSEKTHVMEISVKVVQPAMSAKTHVAKISVKVVLVARHHAKVLPVTGNCNATSSFQYMTEYSAKVVPVAGNCDATINSAHDRFLRESCPFRETSPESCPCRGKLWRHIINLARDRFFRESFPFRETSSESCSYHGKRRRQASIQHVTEYSAKVVPFVRHQAKVVLVAGNCDATSSI